ncbi:SDR family oxidoreductase [Peribacillus saganii]|uniref:SDR family oxidoreductase n=1 Tax=Peribacillus saganii TaxID=2303992 RepID=A0A372LSB6_9BACI|nr:SDR family oxidoreductase [Peribacillus saganii]RFU71073.1 SDR family oxidoreductase [Peribacillus saganii]
METGLKGKNALVIASSQGLGEATARELVNEGANVLLVSRNEDKLQKVNSDLNALGPGRTAFIAADITKTEDIDAIIKKISEEFGGIDILVNNAGGPPAGSFEQMTDEQWQASFELNLLSYIRIIRKALPYLKKNGGKIINIASSSIKEPIPGLILSNTFRTAIVGLSKTLAEELAPFNILVNTVAPGRIATDRVRHLDDVNAEKLGISREEVEKNAKSKIPLGRYGRPEEFARAIVFFASDANTYMTGGAYLVDGGMVRSI